MDIQLTPDYIASPEKWCYASIEHIDFLEEPVSYKHFFDNYLLGNKPCVLGKWATSHWKSRLEWTRNEEPDFEFMAANFGEMSLIQT